MYKLSSGNWKSDFKIDGQRYQQSWDTPIKKEAQKLENDFKDRIRLSKVQQDTLSTVGLDWMLPDSSGDKAQSSITLSEAREIMKVRKWNSLRDSKNPISRMNLIIELLGDIDILTIDNKVIDSLRELLIHKGRAPKTVNHYMSVLKTTIDFLDTKGIVIFHKKPDFNSVRFKEDDLGTRDIVFTKSELAQMLEAFEKVYKLTGNITDFEMLHFYIIQSSLGLRPAEFFNLHLSDIDFINKTVTIARAENGKTKNGVIRTLPLDGRALESFKLLSREVGRNFIKQRRNLEGTLSHSLTLRKFMNYL